MKIRKPIIICLVSASFLVSKGECITENNLTLGKQTRRREGPSTEEIDKTFEESIKKADNIQNELYVFDHFNTCKSYINYFKDSTAELKERSKDFADYRNLFISTHEEIAKEIENYSYVDDSIENLARLYESNFTLEFNDVVYKEDFICDRGRIDFLTNLNGSYKYDFGIGEPSNVLNPDYANVYSVYADVVMEGTETSTKEKEINKQKVKKTGRSAELSTLTTVLLNQGLCYAAIETIKSSFLSIRAAIKYWLPWVARVTIITASIIALTVVFVTYCSQIKQIVYAIIDRFVSVAEKFADKIRQLFSFITDTANKSEGELSFTINNKTSYYRALTSAVAKALTCYGERIYHRAIRSSSSDFLSKGFSSEYVYICMDSLTKKEAARILQSNPKDSETSNTYVPTSRYAKDVRTLAYPRASVYQDHNTTGHGWFLYHYHAAGAATHSFFGLPYYLDK